MPKTKYRTIKEIMTYLFSTRFTFSDRKLIAKLLQQQYKEGFINGQKMNKK